MTEKTVEETLEKSEEQKDDIATELVGIQQQTISGNSVECFIDDLRKENINGKEKYVIDVEFPNGEIKSRNFDKPEVWSTDYEIVELLQELGLNSPGGMEQLPGTSVEIIVTEDGWKFAELRTFREKLEDNDDKLKKLGLALGLSFSGLFLTTAIIAPQIIFNLLFIMMFILMALLTFAPMVIITILFWKMTKEIFNEKPEDYQREPFPFDDVRNQRNKQDKSEGENQENKE